MIELEYLIELVAFVVWYLLCGWDLGLNSVELGKCLGSILNALKHAIP